MRDHKHIKEMRKKFEKRTYTQNVNRIMKAIDKGIDNQNYVLQQPQHTRSNVKSSYMF